VTGVNADIALPSLLRVGRAPVSSSDRATDAGNAGLFYVCHSRPSSCVYNTSLLMVARSLPPSPKVQTLAIKRGPSQTFRNGGLPLKVKGSNCDYLLAGRPPTFFSRLSTQRCNR
jgi:hypothetical protein